MIFKSWDFLALNIYLNTFGENIELWRPSPVLLSLEEKNFIDVLFAILVFLLSSWIKQ